METNTETNHKTNIKYHHILFWSLIGIVAAIIAYGMFPLNYSSTSLGTTNHPGSETNRNINE